MKLTDKRGRQISPIAILIIILALVLFVLLIQRKVANNAKDRSSESNASVKCNICGQDNPPEAHFCANCGATLMASADMPKATVVLNQVAAVPVIAVEYASFWIRFGAAIIDAIAVSILYYILSLLPYLSFVSWLFTLLYYWLFTGLRGQTPGKMVLGIKVVNAQGDRPGLGRAALREILGKLISTIALLVGFLWIAFDSNKQGWHDKIASTYVVKVESRKKDGKEL